MPIIHPFPPVYGTDSRILILGSFPSVKSRETGFYYGHPQNRFWRVMAHVLGCAVPKDIPQKRDMLLSHGIALWDVLAICDINGSSDASIRKPIANDISGLTACSNIHQIYCNGGKARQLCERYAALPPGLPVHTLPSTSPANARYSLEQLCQQWESIIQLQ